MRQMDPADYAAAVIDSARPYWGSLEERVE
jgi:hypothetical protein